MRRGTTRPPDDAARSRGVEPDERKPRVIMWSLGVCEHGTGLLNMSGKVVIRHGWPLIKRYIVGPAASDRRHRPRVDLLERGAAVRVAPLLPLLVVE